MKKILLEIKNFDKSYITILFSLSLSAVFVFISNIFLARYLGPSDYGVFIASLSIVMMLSGYYRGIEGFLLYVFGKEKSKAKRWIKVFTNFILIILFINISILFIWSIFGPHDDLTKNILLIFIFFMIGQVSIDVSKVILQITSSFKVLSFLQLYPSFLKFVFVLIIYYFFNFFDVLNIATGYSIINISALLISFIILKNFLKKSQLKTSKKNFIRNKNLKISDLLKKSKNFITANVYYIFYAPIDILFLKYLVGTFELGIFSAANIIIIGTYLFIEAYMKIYSFRYYYYSKFNFNKFIKLYKNGNFVLLFLSIFLVIILILMSPFIIDFFYGIDYKGSIYTYAKYEVEIFKKILIIKIPLSIYLIFNFEVLGAAISILICEVAIFIYSKYFVNKIFKSRKLKLNNR